MLFLLAALIACHPPDDSTAPSDTDTDTDTDTDADADADADPLAVIGDWSDGGSSAHYVSTELWRQTWYHYVATHEIADFSNADAWVVAQNSPENRIDAGLWSRFEWRWDGDDALWVCQSVLDAPSQEAAVDQHRADGSDPATGGCGSGPWGHFERLP